MALYGYIWFIHSQIDRYLAYFHIWLLWVREDMFEIDKFCHLLAMARYKYEHVF